MKRFRPRARGRGARIIKPFSNLTIKLKERKKDLEINKNKKNKVQTNFKEKELEKGKVKNGTKG